MHTRPSVILVVTALGAFACGQRPPCVGATCQDGGGGAGGGLGGGAGGGLGGGAGGGLGGGAGGGGGGSGGDAGAGRWGNLQWPAWATTDAGLSTTFYGQVWVDGHTGTAGATAGLTAEVGWGPHGTRPDGDAGWAWTPAAFNLDVGNNDELQASIAPTSPGTWDVAFRYRLPAAFSGPLLGDRGDRGRLGSDDGYQVENAGRLVVPNPAGRLKVATLNLQCLTGEVAARLDAAAQRFAQLGTDVIALQEVCLDPTLDGGANDSATRLAALLSASTGRPFVGRFAQTHLANNTTPEGIGLVTALPLSQLEVIDLPLGDFQRKVLLAVVASPVGMVAIAATHFSFRSQDGQIRVDQANAIAAALAQLSPPTPRQVMLGDLNATPTEAPLDALRTAGFVDAWGTVHPGLPGYSHTSLSPTRRIDYAWLRGPLAPVSAELQFTSPFRGSEFVSDHLGLAVELSAR